MLATNTIHLGNTLDLLRQLPDSSIDCCVSSPPYWGLRDYGSSATAIWDAKEGCEHEWGEEIPNPMAKSGKPGPNATVGARFAQDDARRVGKGAYCQICGAWKGQLGLEPDFKLYIKHLADIFDEVKRALKPTGTCWINLGDTYGGSGGAGGDYNEGGLKEGQPRYKQGDFKVQQKSLLQIPSRFAIEMSDRGWILRNKIIWHKKNCMPSSAKDRFTNDYEEIFFFVKSKKYYFEQQYEPLNPLSIPWSKKDKKSVLGNQPRDHFVELNPLGRNKRAVWRIATKPHPFAHFAVYPEELIETPIKAGCPEGGIVLDPFIGSGTTAIVAQRLGRKWMGFEINPEYLQIANKRLGAKLASYVER